MNNSVKNILIFTLGAAAGATGMYIGLKRYFELKADLEVDSVKRAYEERLYGIEEHESTLDGSLEGPDTIDIPAPTRSSLLSKELNNKPDLMDYTKFFKGNGEKLKGVSETIRDAKEDADKDGLPKEKVEEMETDPAELEIPPDDEPYSDEEDEEETLEFENHQLNGAKEDAILNGKDPYEIDASDYELTCSHYEKMSLLYHTIDYEVTTEDEGDGVVELVDKILFVGNVIEQSGFDEDNRDTLYVRNDKMQTDFEITKVYDEALPI